MLADCSYLPTVILSFINLDPRRDFGKNPIRWAAFIMWWNGQNLDAPRTDKTGRVWHFRVWHGDVEGKWIQRIFYWDDSKNETGIVELSADRTLHISRLKQLIANLMASSDFRSQYRRKIEFPVDRNYAVYAKLG